MDLRQVTTEIDKSQTEAIQARATSGQVRAFELTWATLLTNKHKFRVVPALTAKQRQNLRDLISRLGPPEALALINFSVKNWQQVRLIHTFLPVKPVFDSLYFHRDKFLAFMTDEREKNKKSAIEHLKAIEKEPRIFDKISLVDMFKKERAQKCQ